MDIDMFWVVIAMAVGGWGYSFYWIYRAWKIAQGSERAHIANEAVGYFNGLADALGVMRESNFDLELSYGRIIAMAESKNEEYAKKCRLSSVHQTDQLSDDAEISGISHQG